MVSNEKHQKHFDLVRSSHGAYLIEEEEKESVTEKEGNSPVVDAGKLNISSEDTEIKQQEPIHAYVIFLKLPLKGM